MTNWEQRAHSNIDAGNYVPEAKSSGRARRRSPLPLLVFTVLLILGVTAASFPLLETSTQIDVADQVVLEPNGVAQEGDFFEGMDASRVEGAEHDLAETTTLVSTLPPGNEEPGAINASLSSTRIRGGVEGLYTAERGIQVCRTGMLKDNLTAPAGGGDAGGEPEGGEPGDGDAQDAGGQGEAPQGDGAEGDSAESDGARARAAAWAEAAGLDSPDEIPGYIDNLTPVRLRLDTRVTSHRYSGGEAEPYQALLQAGTAVLVDRSGVPAVKCDSGNPLGEPAEVGDLDQETALDVEAIATEPDQVWERFNPEQVATITPANNEVAPFVLTDLASEELLERAVGTDGNQDLGAHDLIVTLQWESNADLDLVVTDPNDAVISATSAAPPNSGGRLEADANIQCEENMTGEEEVTWPAGDAPPGEYTITVSGHAVGDRYQADCGGNQAEFTVTIRRFGQGDEVRTETIRDQRTKDFTVTLDD